MFNTANRRQGWSDTPLTSNRRCGDIDDIISRTEEAFETIIEDTLAKGGGKALVVFHGGEILNILMHYIPKFSGGNLKNCSLSILRYKNGTFTLELVGDMSYEE